MGGLDRALRARTPPRQPDARSRDLWERRRAQQRDLPQAASGRPATDRHRRQRRASAGRLRASGPDLERSVRRWAGVGREGRHQSARLRPGSRLRALAGLPGARWAPRHRHRAAPRGAGAPRAGAGSGSGVGRRGRVLAWRLTGPRPRPRTKLKLHLRLSPCVHSGPWPEAGSSACRRPRRQLRRDARAGRSLVRAWRWGRSRARCRLRREGWRSPGRNGAPAISRSRRRREMDGPLRELRVPSGVGRWAGSGPVPSTRYPPAARTARRGSAPGRRRPAVAAPHRRARAAVPRVGLATLRRWGVAAARQPAPDGPRQRGGTARRRRDLAARPQPDSAAAQERRLTTGPRREGLPALPRRDLAGPPLRGGLSAPARRCGPPAGRGVPGPPANRPTPGRW
jgi:hypothetical protein